MRVIFLDYDGVVNVPMWSEDSENYTCRYNWPEDGKVNSYQAVQWVSEFCEKHGYGIVVSSTWRHYENYKECLINGGLRPGIEIIGATKNLNGDRGAEITDFLETHPEITGYLVFDDEDYDMGKHIDRLVKCDSNHGFMYTEFLLAETLHQAFNKDESCPGRSDINTEHDTRF